MEEHSPGAVLTVMSPGQDGTGFSVSLTVTVKLQEAELLLASVAVQVTVVVPFKKIEPLAGLHTTLPPEQLSVRLALKLTFEEQSPGAVLTVMLPGQVGTGFSVSLTVTLKLHVAALLLASVAVQVTVVVPFAKAEPLAGLHATLPPEQLSVKSAL